MGVGVGLEHAQSGDNEIRRRPISSSRRNVIRGNVILEGHILQSQGFRCIVCSSWLRTHRLT